MVILYDKLYAIARNKAEAMKAEIEKCANCKLLDFVSTPAAQIQQNAGQLVSSWVTKYGPEPIWIVTVGDVFADFLVSPLRSGGIDPSKVKIIGADGMTAAYGRIRAGDYQVATIPQPITQLGYQAVDEMVRALQKQPASGYAPNVYIVEGSNVNLYGGDKTSSSPTTISPKSTGKSGPRSNGGTGRVPQCARFSLSRADGAPPYGRVIRCAAVTDVPEFVCERRCVGLDRPRHFAKRIASRSRPANRNLQHSASFDFSDRFQFPHHIEREICRRLAGAVRSRTAFRQPI